MATLVENATDAITLIENWRGYVKDDLPEKVIIPNGVTTIAPYLLQYKSFEEIEIPNSVINVGQCALSFAHNITELNFPNSVKVIGREVAFSCSSLSTITFGNSLEEIGELSFSETIVEEIILPDSLTTVGKNAFQGCHNLTSVTIGQGLSKISQDMFNACSSLTKIVLPNNIVTIGTQAFQSCTHLTSAVIPVSVTKIEPYSFNLSGLTDIYYRGAESQWENIFIAQNGNGKVRNATIHYNYTGDGSEL